MKLVAWVGSCAVTILSLGVAAPSAFAQSAACEQPKQPGPCRGSFPRWYFDKDAGRCQRFIYGGCQGNDNNFESERACAAACRSRPVPRCEQPKKPGPCRASIPRWYFDKDAGRCQRFIYGGCQANDNNFTSARECASACPRVPVCRQPKKPGPCRGAFPRWYFNATSNRCERFIYGGCQGNANNFETERACKARCTQSR